MARPDTWMPFYGDDYQADTGHCSAVERGAYSDLLWACWKRKNTLPKDDTQLMRLARCTPAEWKQAKYTVMAFFTDDGDHYSHKRVGVELAIATVRYERKVAAGQAGGKASGQARAKQTGSNRSTTVQAEPNESPTQLQPHSPNGESDAYASERPKTKRATSLPEDWQPNERNLRDATDRGYSASRIGELAQHFRDHHRAKGTTSKDWDASWRTWLANDKRFSSGRNGGGKPGHDRSRAGNVVDVVTRLKARAEMGGQGDGAWVGGSGFGLQPAEQFDTATAGAGDSDGGTVIEADDAERMYRASRGIEAADGAPDGSGGQHRGAVDAVRQETRGLPGGRGAKGAFDAAEHEQMVAVVGGVEGEAGPVQFSASEASGCLEEWETIPDFLRRA